MTKDFFRHYYNTSPLRELRSSPADVFQVEYSVPVGHSGFQIPIVKALSAALYVHHVLAFNEKKVPCVFYSGGVDSEALILMFLRAGLVAGQDFEIWHIRYKNGENRGDTEYVEQFIASRGVPVTFIDKDPESWYKTAECLEFCEHYGIVYPTMAMVASTLIEASQKNLYPIIGHGMPDLKRVNTPSGTKIIHADLEYQRTWAKVCAKAKIKAAHTLYRTSYDLYRGVLLHLVNYLDTWEKESTSEKLSLVDAKADMFSSLNMAPRPKFTGHERFWKPDYPHVVQVATKLAPKLGYDHQTGYLREVHEFMLHWGYQSYHLYNPLTET